MKTIEVGAVVPDFELPDQDGVPRRLSELVAAGPVVLFFYPAAMSGGCTAEACTFRNRADRFAALGAQRIGISMDGVGKQQAFTQSARLDYPLLADVDGKVAESVGVRKRFITPVKRVTLVIDRERVVRFVIASEFRMRAHADKALEYLAGRA